MSFGLKKSFGRICKSIEITGMPFPRIRASGMIYSDYECIEKNGTKWFITPDGRYHDEIEIETEEYYYSINSDGICIADKRALAKLK